jgi:hypothetical protein
MEKPDLGDLRRFNGGKRKGAGRKPRGKVRLTIHANAMTAEFLRERATASKKQISEVAEMLVAAMIQAVMECQINEIRKSLERTTRQCKRPRAGRYTGGSMTEQETPSLELTLKLTKVDRSDPF